jgi:hypothetical protein
MIKHGADFNISPLSSDILSKNLFQLFNNTRFHRIFVVTARAVDTMAATGTASAPHFALIFLKFKATKAADHVNHHVTNNLVPSYFIVSFCEKQVAPYPVFGKLICRTTAAFAFVMGPLDRVALDFTAPRDSYIAQ